jgi:hypothetical protein
MLVYNKVEIIEPGEFSAPSRISLPQRLVDQKLEIWTYRRNHQGHNFYFDWLLKLGSESKDSFAIEPTSVELGTGPNGQSSAINESYELSFRSLLAEVSNFRGEFPNLSIKSTQVIGSQILLQFKKIIELLLIPLPMVPVSDRASWVKESKVLDWEDDMPITFATIEDRYTFSEKSENGYVVKMIRTSTPEGQLGKVSYKIDNEFGIIELDAEFDSFSPESGREIFQMKLRSSL